MNRPYRRIIMTREEIIEVYKRGSPVIFKSDEGLSFRYKRIHGYEVRRNDKGEEEFRVILYEEEPKGRIYIVLPESVCLTEG